MLLTNCERGPGLHTRSGHDERHVRVEVVRRALASVELELAEVEAVVGGQEEVGVRSGLGAQPAEHPVDRLHHPGAVAVLLEGALVAERDRVDVPGRGRGGGPVAAQVGRRVVVPRVGVPLEVAQRQPAARLRAAVAARRVSLGRPVGEGRRERRVVGVGLLHLGVRAVGGDLEEVGLLLVAVLAQEACRRSRTSRWWRRPGRAPSPVSCAVASGCAASGPCRPCRGTSYGSPTRGSRR